LPLDDDDEEEEVAAAAAAAAVVSTLKISPKKPAAPCLDIEKDHKVIEFFKLGYTFFA